MGGKQWKYFEVLRRSECTVNPSSLSSRSLQSSLGLTPISNSSSLHRVVPSSRITSPRSVVTFTITLCSSECIEKVLLQMATIILRQTVQNSLWLAVSSPLTLSIPYGLVSMLISLIITLAYRFIQGGVLLSTVSDPTSFNNFSQITPYAQSHGEGLFCLPFDLSLTNATGLQDGQNVTIQVSTLAFTSALFWFI